MNILFNKDGKKKQRGSNYTPRERAILLELIKKNVEIIENKETNSAMCSKKREAWNAITRRYNALAATGHRDWKQLRHLYENLKQRRKTKMFGQSVSNSPDSTKKNGTAKRKNAHILSLPVSPSQQLYVNSVNELNEEASSDVKEISCTDDTSALADVDKQVQASPKTDPLQFGTELTGDDMKTVIAPAKRLSINKEEIEEDSISEGSTSRESPDDTSKKKKLDNKTCHSPAKEEYFKQKLKNAKLERKFLIERHKMEKKKHTVELEILKLQRLKLLT